MPAQGIWHRITMLHDHDGVAFCNIIHIFHFTPNIGTYVVLYYHGCTLILLFHAHEPRGVANLDSSWFLQQQILQFNLGECPYLLKVRAFCSIQDFGTKFASILM
ncbi:MAG: hypothetical protein C7B46_04745 [Sulfobacillus benefaciens]|uniref:Uncharacterized protein n=1 Tax=Sulfobacillus benefaciens TaxID=453960 RepID=A0A2T2XJR6_9FIRM|nr:MAG: hypothetical protein C7B46_04745 [Sulfobacillus benefaciens]